MSWWNIGGDDAIGDKPVDRAALVLTQITEDRARQGKQKLTLQEFGNGICIALGEWLKIPVGKVIIKPKDKPEVESVRDGPIDTQLAGKFITMFDDIGKTYMERWERNPNLHELLEILVFELSYQPERYLSVTAGTEIEGIGYSPG